MEIENRKVRYDYFIEESYEAGIMLQGWEVKAIRAGRVSLQAAYVIVRDEGLHLLGATITPLIQTSSHVPIEPDRTRKLLLHKNDAKKMIDKVQRAGYTIVPVDIHFTNGLVKVQVGLAKGKKQHDKRDVEQERDMKRDVERAMKGSHD
jgi:SsrA-binding protein